MSTRRSGYDRKGKSHRRLVVEELAVTALVVLMMLAYRLWRKICS